MKPEEIEKFLNSILHPEDFNDYCFNGIQIQGYKEINKVVTAVSFSDALVERAVLAGADAILVHHGIFGKEFFRLSGYLKRRVERILSSGITLFGYHLPLDANEPYGNNYSIAKEIGLVDLERLDVGFVGTHPENILVSELRNSLCRIFPRQEIGLYRNSDFAGRTCVISGGSSSNLRELEGTANTFISGEVGEPTREIARETGINFFWVGHYASERFGVMNLGELLRERLSLEVEFVEIYNEV
ncbi:MAG: Nif3-like dinuclear metal center hexameric protein [Kosmotogaceae bacterium]|nr:Nif3-like dinuclear metal center hexameric protein [Kosmotogaceae bacterium]